MLKTRHWDRLDNGGLTFTELGFGTAPLGNLYTAISDIDARATLDSAWEGGVRYYDTAPLYGLGLSETRLNPFLRDKPEVCQKLAERGDFDLFLLAGRYTLLEQTALDSFLPLCEQRGIGIVTGGPYNSGILASGAQAGAWYNYDPAPQHIIDRVNAIEHVCNAHNVRMVDAAFQFPLLHPAHVAVIPGGQNVSEMAGNLNAAHANIPAALWADLKTKDLLRDDAPTSK